MDFTPASKISKLHIISFLIKGSQEGNLSERRRINKNFLNCLVEVKGSRPLALVWLKCYIDYEICDVMLSDWRYSGELKIK